jgi:hypothetical protein
MIVKKGLKPAAVSQQLPRDNPHDPALNTSKQMYTISSFLKYSLREMHKVSNRVLCWKCHVFYFCGLRMTVVQTEGNTQLYGLRNDYHVARCGYTACNSHMNRKKSQKVFTLPLFQFDDIFLLCCITTTRPCRGRGWPTQLSQCITFKLLFYSRAYAASFCS